jgi:hypothetical protein
MKLKVRDRHVIAGLLFMTVVALTLSGCEAESEARRGKNIRLCLEDHSPKECAMLFPSPHTPKDDKADESEDD